MRGENIRSERLCNNVLLDGHKIADANQGYWTESTCDACKLFLIFFETSGLRAHQPFKIQHFYVIHRNESADVAPQVRRQRRPPAFAVPLHWLSTDRTDQIGRRPVLKHRWGKKGACATFIHSENGEDRKLNRQPGVQTPDCFEPKRKRRNLLCAPARIFWVLLGQQSPDIGNHRLKGCVRDQQCGDGVLETLKRRSPQKAPPHRRIW